MNQRSRTNPVVTLLLAAAAAIACAPPPPPDDHASDRATDASGDDRFPDELPDGFALSDYGDVDVVGGETSDLVFDASADVQSFFVVGVGGDDDFVILLSERDPDRVEVGDDTAPDPDAAYAYFGGFTGPSTSANRVAGRPRAMAALLPNTPRIAMKPGTWTFRVGVFHAAADENDQPLNEPVDGTLHVGVVARTEAPPAAGAVDLVISVHPSSGLTAASAPNDPTLSAALATVDTALGAVGVHLGDVVYLDVDADLEQPLDLGGPACNGGASLAHVFDSVEPARNALHIVLIGSFTCLRFGGLLDVGASLAALSNGIPVVPFSARDGVVVATALKDTYPEDWSRVLAHEIGHSLGLFHTEEAIAGIYDNIADTDDDDAVHYLMYANVTTSQSTKITPEQGRVIRAHPLVIASP